jgi:hypothetical protein
MVVFEEFGRKVGSGDIKRGYTSFRSTDSIY